jgi:uncharacterized protein YcbK (DUF882 family)
MATTRLRFVLLTLVLAGAASLPRVHAGAARRFHTKTAGSAADVYIDPQKKDRMEDGLGYYPATSAHPPFVHVDVRGTPMRWRG